jgi:zinc transport system ATP-binding protein
MSRHASMQRHPTPEAVAPPGEARAQDGRALLACESLVIGYGGRPLLPPIDLRVEAGHMLLIVGRNGAGKSTLVRTLLGLLPPVGGQVRRSRQGLRMAYVPQAAALDEIVPVRAREVVDWGLLRGWGFLRPWLRHADREAVERGLGDVGAQSFKREPFRELSGGQKQRVLFARLLAAESEVVLLDEPTASMDMTSEQEAYERMAALARSGVAVIVVTHTVGLAARFASSALLLDRSDRHQTGLVLSGTLPEVFSHPQARDLFPGVEVGGP